ncbi:hypothetical protein Tco_0190152 [Tanacetum coccineum]
MSSMGELTFFLGLQVKQTTAGIFLSQDKYVKDILNKFDFRTIKPSSTPIEAHKSLGKDEDDEDVDVHLYRFQVTPKVSHMHAVKRIFRYLKHQPKLGLWYPKDSPFHLEAFADSGLRWDNHDKTSTSEDSQYLAPNYVAQLQYSVACLGPFGNAKSTAKLMAFTTWNTEIPIEQMQYHMWQADVRILYTTSAIMKCALHIRSNGSHGSKGFLCDSDSSEKPHSTYIEAAS